MDSPILNLEDDLLSFLTNYDTSSLPPLDGSLDLNDLLNSSDLQRTSLESDSTFPPLFNTEIFNLPPPVQGTGPVDTQPPPIIPALIVKKEPSPTVNKTTPSKVTKAVGPVTKKRPLPATKPKPSKRPRKKQKAESDFISNLAGLTSDDLINFRKTNSLSVTQERELKNHTRKIKNRESAILSRQRRKAYQDELEEKMKNLEVDNKDLEKTLLKLEAQNDVLKSEFLEFQKMISKSAELSKLFLRQNNLNPKLQHAEEVAAKIASPAAAEDTSKTKEDAFAFVYLLIVIHSFASHFNNDAAVIAKNILADSNCGTTTNTNAICC